MKDETLARVEQEVGDWAYLSELPDEVSGFRLRREMKASGDMYKLFSYENTCRHRAVTAYFHEETMEYKLLEQVGLCEFCRLEFIAVRLEVFDELLRAGLNNLLEGLADLSHDMSDIMLSDTQLDSWEYGRNLPPELEGFTLFVRPYEPLKFTNGSYLVINYSDFGIASDFSIIYNAFRDEFFGEAKIRAIPDVSYLFDAPNLKELEGKLASHLTPRLQEIRRLAEQRSRGVTA